MGTLVRVCVVPADTNLPVRVLEIQPTGDAFRKAIGGGWLEGFGGDGWYGYRDEDGCGGLMNYRAIGLAQFASPANVRLAGLGQHRQIWGDVVFFGPADEEGNETDIPDWWISILRSVYPSTEGI